MAADRNVHHAPAPVGGPLFNTATLVCGVLIAIMIAVLAVRFVFGLGAVTNLNDGYPWGIWVVVDVVIGSAFACGGFSVAMLVYIFNKGQYHPLVRPALLASLFGIEISTAGISHAELMIFGGLIVWFLIVEPHGLAKLWSIAKQKLRLWPFPH